MPPSPGWRGNAAMSRDRKGSPSVSPSESSEAWLESHASEPGGLREDALPDAGRHCWDAGKLFPRRAVPKAPRGARPVQTERASMPCTTQTRIVEMKLFRKEKKPAGAYCCSICKRVYRHAGMAERCTRTAVCRLYNTPPAEVREAWRLVGGAAPLGWFLAHRFSIPSRRLLGCMEPREQFRTLRWICT